MFNMDCKWTVVANETEDHWDTACGGKFQLEAGTPSDNDFKFCAYCGGTLIEVVPKDCDEICYES